MRRWMMGLAVLAVATPAVAAPETWLVSVDRWGNAEHTLLTLETTDGGLSGRFGDWALEGHKTGDRLVFAATDSHGVPYKFEATEADGVLTGWADYPDTSNAGPRVRHGFTARRLEMPTGAPGRRTYAPTQFSNTFTADLAPAMVIQPGDVVATRTVDSGGID